MTSTDNTSGIVAFGLRYRTLVILITSALVIFGVYALMIMDKNEFPGFTIREGLVVAVVPGANASQIESEVLKPLEDFVFGYKEVNKTTTYSRCTSGMLIMFVELDDNVTDTEPFWNKLQIALQAEKMKLPSNVLAVEALTDFGDTSALLISLSSDTKSYRELGSMLDDLRQRLRGIKSVGQMSEYGEQTEQISVIVDNDKLAHYGIKANTLALAMAAQGFNTTGGEIKGEEYTMPIYVSRPANTLYDISSLIVFATPDGSTVRLSDIAEVKREYPAPASYITNNGAKSLLLSVSMKSGNNIVEMGREVQKVLDEFEQTLPADVSLFKITDQPTVVNSSVNDFLTELLIAIVAVVVVIMVLLPIKVALIAAATIPVTIFISLGFFYILGFELNTVTLACLIVSLGMIVDNSVVIIDNYVELISDGMDHWTAAYQSAVEFLKAIFSATCAISITFFPFLLTLNGMFRDFMNDFPWAISIILFTSLVIAEMLVPFLQYKLIKKPIYKLEKEAVESGKKKFSFFTSLQNWYNKLADLCFAWPKTTLAAGLVSVVLGVWLFVSRPMKLMPIAERNQFAVEIYLPTGSSLAKTDAVADSLAAVLSADKRVVSVATFHGCSSPRFQTTYAPQVGGPNFAQFIVNTVSNEATIEVLNEYTPKFESYFPDAYCRFKQLSYSTADYPVMVRVSGSDFRELQSVADSVLDRMRKMPGLRLARPNTSTPQMGAMVRTDDAKMGRMGISSLFLEGTLAMRYSAGVPVATMWEGDYGLPIVIRTRNAYSSTPEALESEQIPVLEFGSAPLGQIAQVEPVWDYGLVEHYNSRPTITLYAENERDFNTIELTQQLQKDIASIDLPGDVSIAYGGDYENTFDILPEIIKALMIAIGIIFFIILMHYKQVGVSVILLVSLLLCIPGAAFGLIVMNEPISLTCTLGIISLMGILVRNAIIMIDYAEEIQTKESLDNRQASCESAKRRMRPIFLTSAAATMGVLPMVLTGSALWKPMGTVIFFGTPITMVFTLTVIPVAMWIFSGKGKLAPAPAKPFAAAALLLMLTAPSAGAQQVLTLDDCKQMAVENNAGVKIAAGKAEQAAQTRKEAFTKYFPQISAQATGFRSNKPVIHYNVLDVFSIDLIHKGTGVSVQAMQPLFAGGRIANGNKLAKVGEEAGRLEYQAAVDNAGLTAEKYYWQVATLKSKGSTLDAATAYVEGLTRQVGAAVDAGMLNRNELLKVQLKLNELKALKIDLDNGIALSKKLLAQYVGLDGQDVDIAFDSVPEQLPPYPSDLFIDESQALPSTVDYKLLEAQVKAADLEKRMALGANLPTIAAGAGYFYDDLLNQNYGFAAAMLTVQVPLSGWWGGAHSMKKASIAAENARLEKEDLSQMLKIKMADEWDNLTAAYRKMALAKESIEQARENLRITRNVYDAGMSTINDVLDAEALYRQASDQYIESYGAYRLCAAQYLNSTGRGN